jgi:hypothetical protein
LSAEKKYRQMTPADQRKRLCRVRTSIWTVGSHHTSCDVHVLATFVRRFPRTSTAACTRLRRRHSTSRRQRVVRVAGS